MTAKIGAAIGKPLRFQPIPDEEERQQKIAWGAPEPLVEARLSIFPAIREERLATVEHIPGGKPITFDQWVEQNAAAYC
jgi:hypothetical protein